MMPTSTLLQPVSGVRARLYCFKGHCSLPSVIPAAGKGFGQSSKSQSVDEGDAPNARGKQRRVKLRREESPIPNQNQQQQLPGAFQAVEDMEAKMQKQKEDEEFAQRLMALKAEGEIRAQEVKKAAPAAPGSGGPQIAAFDKPAEDIYASPPSIADTLLTQLNSDVSDPKLKNANIGPNQIAVAVGAVIFGAIFLIVSGGDFATSKRYKGVRPAQQPPDAIEQGLIKSRIAQLENKLEADPQDADTVEQLAVSYAQLFQFEQASEVLDTLLQSRPNDAEAWRLLGETTLLSQQSARSVAAYEKAITLRDNDLQIVTGLVDAYIADGKQAKAADFLKSLRDRTATASTSSSAAAGDTPVAAPAPSVRPFDDVSVELLLGKTYSAWRGHDVEAQSAYDQLVKDHPEDFRAYLARGVFLKEQGKRAEADKMFIQARFYAPETRKAFVKRLTEDNPLLDLPDNS